MCRQFTNIDFLNLKTKVLMDFYYLRINIKFVFRMTEFKWNGCEESLIIKNYKSFFNILRQKIKPKETLNYV
jgi:hypothetical protein